MFMPKIVRFLIVMSLLCMVSASTGAQSIIIPTSPTDSTTFALSVYDQLRVAEGNLFFSPYSINTAFLMVYAGAGGDTAQQIADVLHITPENSNLHEQVAQYTVFIRAQNNADKTEYSPERVFSVSNALWVQQDFALDPDYPETLAEFYSATITPTDFVNDPEGSRQLINDTVAQQTRERIQNLIPDGVIDQATRLILTNAVYFKANWAKAFTPLESAPFTLSDETVVDVPSMITTNDMPYFSGDGITLVAVPYDGWNSQMVIIMPDDFATYEAGLLAGGLPNLGDVTFAKIHLTMPKFTFESSFGLSDTLVQLGMSDAFNPDLANFSGMSQEPLFIQEALHKAFIGVDENGTEAAAATAVIVGVTSAMPQPVEPIEVKIDKPFLFYIQDNVTQEILFMGRVMNPQS